MEKKYILSIAILVIIGMAAISCSEKREPLAVSTHPDGWLEESSAKYHGKAVLASGTESCKSCHGQDFSGGSAGISCAGCHELFPHPDGFKNPDDQNFHGKFIAKSISWKIGLCKDCHGNDYSGGTSGQSCLVCHTESGGPEACNVCHGSENNFAPPKDLAGNQATSAIGVGAHQAHLNNSTYTTSYTKDCRLCHKMPLLFSDATHIDDSPNSEVLFNAFAADSGKTEPAWHRESGTCENVYCHGAFTLNKSESSATWGYADSVITGNNVTMSWTNVGAEQDSCGSCHNLPPTGHIPAISCNSCHGRVVDDSFNIIDKKLHINGRIELF
jgi:predicted CxxxxCH...CXXCH cytochrome family protein